MNPIVSICIPTYNQTKYLKKCLESVLIQNFVNFELIISDDTPNDTVEQFIKSLLINLPYTYINNKPALGTPNNWNAAIEKAKGKYIKLLHHDDFFTQANSLKLMVDEIEKNKCSFLFCQTDVWHIKSNTHHLHQISSKQLKLLHNKPELLFFKNVIGSPSTTLHINNKSFAYDSKFKWLVDVEFYMDYLFSKKNICYLKKPLISTIHGSEGQVTESVLNDKHIQIKEHVLLFNKFKNQFSLKTNFKSFFDYLFFKYEISSFDNLIKIVPEASENKYFFDAVFTDINKFRSLKWFKKRCFESRYNNYIFKLEQYL